MKKLNEINKDQMPYERCARFGPESLTDTELLAIILRTGTRDADVMTLADSIISPKGNAGLSELLYKTYEEYVSMKGIGKVKAIQLLCIGEISKRLWRYTSANEGLCIRNPETCARYYLQDMKFLEREQFRVAFLDIRNRLIRDMILTKGTADSSLVSVRDVLSEALKHRATSIIILHNHPSGDPDPSSEDIDVTRRIQNGCDAIGIKLCDHIIIGANKYYSFKERGLI